MLQNTYLLFEIIVLIAVLATYILHRKLATRLKASTADIQKQTADEIALQNTVQEQAVGMIRDLATLLEDVQTVADKTRADIVSQVEGLTGLLKQADQAQNQKQHLATQTEEALTVRDDLQNLLDQAKVSFTTCDDLQVLVKQAEAAAMVRNELRVLLDQAGPTPAALPSPNPQPLENDEVMQAQQADGPPKPGLAKILPEFRKHLHTKGYSQSTVASLMAQVKHFASWLGGQRYSEIQLTSIKEAEISTYESHLKKQKLQQATIKRKMTALHTFYDWVTNHPSLTETHQVSSSNNLTPLMPAPQTLPEAEVTAPSAQVTLTSQPSENLTERPALPEKRLADYDTAISSVATALDEETVSRPPKLITGYRQPTPYQAVFALADQGLDRVTIASKTGLEQETIRMLLAQQGGSIMAASLSSQARQ